MGSGEPECYCSKQRAAWVVSNIDLNRAEAMAIMIVCPAEWSTGKCF